MRVKHCTKLLCAAALVCRTAFPESGASARELFASALELVKEGELDAAAARFEEAYRLSPNYAVLYNLGQAYVALGKPVEAVQALEKFLELGGTRITPTRRHEVQDLLLFSKKRIGFASLSVEPPSAELSVDGQPVATSAGREHRALTVGTHSVTATAAGYAPFVGNLTVIRDQTATLAIALRAQAQSLPAKLGQLAVESPVPATDISLDGAAAPGSRPDPVMIALGHHYITCTRDGYISFARQVEVTELGVARVACDLKVDPHLAASRAGILSLSIIEPGAIVHIDGRHSALTLKLPQGPHRVLVQRLGFEDWTRTVVARPGFPETVTVTLRPTAEHALELQHAAQSRRNWAYVTGGAGVAFLASAVILYVDNNQRYASWQRDRDALSRDIQTQNWTPSLNERAQTLQVRAASVQGRDDLALGATVLGGALLSYAAATWFSARR